LNCSDSLTGITLVVMTDVTVLLQAAAAGDRQAAGELLPLVYAELRRLASRRLASESAGHTLQPTALVHEAYLRLVGDSGGQEAARWEGRGHFFAAATEAMRRILVESARSKQRLKRGGDLERVPLDEVSVALPEADERLLDLDAALDKLAEKDPRKADLVKLRYFTGLTIAQAAEALGIADSTANRDWDFARAWLLREMGRTEASTRAAGGGP
jgi:RNA polymerase sigma factor (TIGR02999 family)